MEFNSLTFLWSNTPKNPPIVLKLHPWGDAPNPEPLPHFYPSYLHLISYLIFIRTLLQGSGLSSGTRGPTRDVHDVERVLQPGGPEAGRRPGPFLWGGGVGGAPDCVRPEPWPGRGEGGPPTPCQRPGVPCGA